MFSTELLPRLLQRLLHRKFPGATQSAGTSTTTHSALAALTAHGAPRATGPALPAQSTQPSPKPNATLGTQAGTARIPTRDALALTRDTPALVSAAYRAAAQRTQPGRPARSAAANDPTGGGAPHH